MSGKPVHNFPTRRSIFALRIAMGSAVLAASLALSLISRAQDGPGWEVPSHVVMMLEAGPRFTIVLIIVASSALILALTLGDIPRAPLIGTVTALVTAVLLTFTIIQLEPAQWPHRHPNASAVASAVTWPTIFVWSAVFWLLTFYFGASASQRGTLKLVGGIIASIIGVVLCLAGLYALMFMKAFFLN